MARTHTTSVFSIPAHRATRLSERRATRTLRSRRARYSRRNELATILADYAADVTPHLLPPVRVPLYQVFRHGAEFIRITEGREPSDRYEAHFAAGHVMLPASACNAGDFYDHSFAKWAERNEMWDTYDGIAAQADATLAALQAEEAALLADAKGSVEYVPAWKM